MRSEQRLQTHAIVGFVIVAILALEAKGLASADEAGRVRREESTPAA